MRKIETHREKDETRGVTRKMDKNRGGTRKKPKSDRSAKEMTKKQGFT